MKLLLHICCGPCSTYPSRVLTEEGIEFEGLYFNPNIHPVEEFYRRKENVIKFAEIKNIKVDFIDDIRQDVWEQYENDDVSRCRMCYAVRLEKAAEHAKSRGFDAFTTTLLVSPYQNHELIKEMGNNFAQKHGIAFYYRDFREGFRKGQQEAREIGLYRQKYCGCIVSFKTTLQNK